MIPRFKSSEGKTNKMRIERMGMANKVRFKKPSAVLTYKFAYNMDESRTPPPTEKLVAIAMAPTEPSISDPTVHICLTTYTFFRRLNQLPRVIHILQPFKMPQPNPLHMLLRQTACFFPPQTLAPFSYLSPFQIPKLRLQLFGNGGCF